MTQYRTEKESERICDNNNNKKKKNTCCSDASNMDQPSSIGSCHQSLLRLPPRPLQQIPSVNPSEEESPIFLQFLDCVYQLYLQFPNKFAFNIEFLSEMAMRVQGTRWGNCELDRRVFQYHGGRERWERKDIRLEKEGNRRKERKGKGERKERKGKGERKDGKGKGERKDGKGKGERKEGKEKEAKGKEQI